MADVTRLGQSQAAQEIEAQEQTKRDAQEQQFLARGGMSPWIHLLGQWGGVPGMAQAGKPTQAPAPRMSLADQIALEQMKQSGRERLAKTKAAYTEKKEKIPAHRYTAAMYATDLNTAHGDLEKLMKEGFDPTGLAAGAQTSSLYPERLKSEGIKRYEQLKESFINAALRPETGAAIAEHEFERAEKRYFPQPGDGPKELKQKRTARLLRIREMQKKAGGALEEAKTIQKEAGGRPAFKEHNGVLYRYNPASGKWKAFKRVGE